jgi:hypothetical protein
MSFGSVFALTRWAFMEVTSLGCPQQIDVDQGLVDGTVNLKDRSPRLVSDDLRSHLLAPRPAPSPPQQPAPAPGGGLATM